MSQVLATSNPWHGSGCICLSQGMSALELWEQKPNHPLFGPQEALEACQTRISKMELQQQQQQVVQLEGLENATARNLLGKLINILLAVMAVLLVFVSTVANCVVPLMKTRNRTFSTLFLVAFIAFLWKHWDALFSYVDRLFSPPRWCWCRQQCSSPSGECMPRELDSSITHSEVFYKRVEWICLHLE